VISPQFFWFKKLRTNLTFMFILSIFINIGMWFERFVIIASSLHRDFLPSSWGYFTPTFVDILTFLGTFGLFLTLFLFFVRFLPMIAVSEVKGMMANEAMHHAFTEQPTARILTTRLLVWRQSREVRTNGHRAHQHT
jgi:molybdopterin-containing oxidoreductase family membrane subunit